MAEGQHGLGLVPGDVDVAEVSQQVRRICESALLRNSPVLQSFLRFVTDRAMRGHEAEISEYSIATEVFARNAGFDASADTIVRTQAYRLRSKLQQYYETVGHGDPVLIDIPKGHYVPVFRPNEPAAAATAEVTVERLPRPATGASWKMPAVVAGSIAIFALGWVAGVRTRTPVVSSAAAHPAPDPVEAFWLSFLEKDRQPIVAYTNGQFLGTESGDLLRFNGGAVADRGTIVRNPAQAGKRTGSPLYYEDDYTGVGEVQAAVAISHALSGLTGRLPFKRSRLVTAYDLHNHNVIFLGSPAVNAILYDLPQPKDFVFRSAAAFPFLWRSHFDNLQPAAGESASYALERDPSTGVLRADYASITLLPGIAPGRKILVLAGLTTSGTEAAAESLTSRHGVLELAGKLGVQNPADPKKWPEAFQSLLRAELSRGLDVIQSKPVAARVIKARE